MIYILNSEIYSYRDGVVRCPSKYMTGTSNVFEDESLLPLMLTLTLTTLPLSYSMLLHISSNSE